MNKEKSLLHGKFSLANILWLGIILLGIGLISWALLNITIQSVYSGNDYSSSTDGPNTFAAKQVSLREDIAALREVGQAFDKVNPGNIFYFPMDASTTEPAHTSAVPEPDIILYPVYPVEGDNIGSLSIPVLKQELPIIQGTGEDELKKGVGHFIQSVLPGEKDNCVLSGHRDTVFTKLGKLDIGDQLIVQTSAGMFTYEIKRIRIVDKDDKTVIVPTDNAVLTLTTCYPFDFVGSAPDRYIISADLVKSKLNPEPGNNL